MEKNTIVSAQNYCCTEVELSHILESSEDESNNNLRSEDNPTFRAPNVNTNSAEDKNRTNYSCQTLEETQPKRNNDDSSAVNLLSMNEEFLIQSDTASSECTEKHLSRWKKANPSKWKININKEKRGNGLAYESKSGKMQTPKKPKPVGSHENCKYRCMENFSYIEREQLCREYHLLEFTRQKDFLLTLVSENPVMRKRVRTGSSVGKTVARSYFFKKSGKNIRVCKQFFCKTLSISQGPVDTAFHKMSSSGTSTCDGDKRGHKVPGNKTRPEVFEKVKEHINKFPVMESHYCRKSTKRKYLDSNLSISKMYHLYKQESIENGNAYVNEITYRRIFGTNFNLSFFKPKKDQCAICTKYSQADSERKLSLENEYGEHLNRRDAATNLKNNENVRAGVDTSFVVATFDLQSVLQIPCGKISELYYTRKLNVYNFTVYEAALPHKAYCYTWTEINGQRGSCEIGTCILKWLQSLDSTVKEVSLFSDTCSGQNRNQFIACMFLYALRQCPNLNVIQHNFLEKGHSYMEVDSMHSAIESAHKFTNIFAMPDWLNVFKMARSKRLKNKTAEPYNVNEIKWDEFLDFKDLSKSIMKNRIKDNNGHKIEWLRIKRMRYEKQRGNIILFSYDYDSDYNILNINGRGRPSEFPKTIKPLYTGKLPISEAKRNDLLKLCSKGIIPEEYQSWFHNLPFDRKQRNAVPEPFIDSDSEDDNFNN